MKAVVVYDTYFLNTTRIAEAVTEAMEGEGAEARMERIYQLDFSSLGDIDMFIIGSPTHIGGMPRPVKSVLKRLLGDTLKGIRTATFDTRYQMPARKSGSAALRIARMLKKLGGEELVSPESFFVTERRGPLVDGELERAKAWAGELLAASC